MSAFTDFINGMDLDGESDITLADDVIMMTMESGVDETGMEIPMMFGKAAVALYIAVLNEYSGEAPAFEGHDDDDDIQWVIVDPEDITLIAAAAAIMMKKYAEARENGSKSS
jgi:hypothetical protein